MAMMTAEQALENAKGITFEQFWASMNRLQERQDRFQEQQEAAWAKQKEAWAKQEEADAEARARGAKLDAYIDKLTKDICGTRSGLIESLMTSRLWVKFNQYGYHFVRAYHRVQLFNEKNEELTDIAILLSSIDECMAVEVKWEANTGVIERHLKRMKLIEKYPPAEVRGKSIYSAIAGVVVPAEVRDYAWSKGMYVLEMNGEQVSLLTPPEGFTEKAW
jgi:hypothetical protein